MSKQLRHRIPQLFSRVGKQTVRQKFYKRVRDACLPGPKERSILEVVLDKKDMSSSAKDGMLQISPAE